MDIDETYTERIQELTDKSMDSLTKNNISIEKWVMWKGHYKGGGFHSLYINYLTIKEITELKMYGFAPL